MSNMSTHSNMERLEPVESPVRRSAIGHRFHAMWKAVDRCDKRISTSTFGRIFRLEGSGHPKEIPDTSFFREIRAGVTTFATMAYIIAVNAIILSQTGGTCECDLVNRADCDNIGSYKACKENVRLDLITATAAIAGLASFIFGFFTNLPVALAPGMGLNAYFAFQVVGPNGSGNIPYRVALTAVFVEGLIFIVLALTGMRQWLVKLIPATIKTATGVGIGFFLTEIGLSYSAGIGAITGGWKSTPLAIAGCPVEMIDPDTQMCAGGIMSSPKMWTAIFAGGLVTAYLMSFRVKYALIMGIALVSILSWPRNTSITYFPYNEEGENRFNFFKNVVTFHPIQHTLNALDWDVTKNGSQFALALFTFLYVDIIDATATLYSMVRFCGVVDPKDGDFPRSTIAYCCDAACISIGSLFGCSPVTAFIESGAGIAEGGRTGLTSMTTGLCFLVSIFFAPIFASIPPWATGCTLVLVGCMMIRQITQINWRYIGDVLPSFVVMTFIPFSYSVAYGLIAGVFVYTVLNGLIALTVWLSGGRIEPREYDAKEYWSWRGSGKKPWFVRAVRNSCFSNGDNDSKRQFNMQDDHDSSYAPGSRMGSSDQKEDGVHMVTIPQRAGVFTYLLENLGVKGVQFEELLTLSPDELAPLQPIYGIIFLFRYPSEGLPARPADSYDRDAAESLFFAQQTIQNACGTQALLSVVLNKTNEVEIGEKLGEFREFTMVLPPEFRGEALSNSELIRDVHNSFAKSSPFVDETQKTGEAEDAFHFIAYTPINGKLYELDGLQPAPISHGACTTEEFPTKVTQVLQDRMLTYASSEIRFNVLAMVRDPRIAAKEIGDSETLERENEKRRNWRFENALRRHNFVGFAGEVLKGVVAQKVEGGDAAYDAWIKEGLERRKRDEDAVRLRRKMGGGGDDDEEMIG
ncbi:permease [Colletotrichum costaricense]|uniref:ubiquitinyl hydrolase 1 n=1 Tax=Colletotrichum costaricense TaxID=1209916 RepID=A0AAJ0DZS7_9PEZI|nr:permease [Colletotrichum costaricense]KAK1526178.1 permease [Colletotrichum costaricense]